MKTLHVQLNENFVKNVWLWIISYDDSLTPANELLDLTKLNFFKNVDILVNWGVSARSATRVEASRLIGCALVEDINGIPRLLKYIFWKDALN